MNPLGQKVSTSIGILAVISAAIFLIWITFRLTSQIETISASIPSADYLISSGDEINACTEEAKICPDGSSVVRMGPNCEFSPCPKNGQLVGGDQDEHGCIGSAGYSWCEAKQKCLRVWEEKCIK